MLSDGDGHPHFYINGSGSAHLGGFATLSDASASGSLNITSASTALECYRKTSSTNTICQMFSDESSTKSLRFGFRANGGLLNHQSNNANLSDEREKTDIKASKDYLDIINAIPVKTFKYTNQSADEPSLGLIAQDVQAVAPELVTEDDWGTKDNPKTRLGIFTTDMQYAVMKALQELSAKNDALEARIKTLEG